MREPGSTFVAALFGIVVLGAALYFPLTNLAMNGSTDDWRWFTFAWEVERTSLVEYGQLPFWNPYHCGGTPELANGQTQFLSPLFWPALLLGVTLGLKLFLVLHYVIGFFGTWLWVRHLGVRGMGALAAPAVFVLSGYFAHHTGGGHSSFLPFLTLPLVLYCFDRSLDSVRWVAAVGLLVALIAVEGGVYPLPYTALTLGLYAGLRTLQWKHGVRPLLRLAVAMGIAFAVAAVKLLPVLSFLGEIPRPITIEDSITWRELLEILTSFRTERRYGGHEYVWPEYAAHIGWPALVVAALSAVLLIRRVWVFVVMAALFLLLSMGSKGSFWPYELLRRLPLYDSLQVPTRLMVVATLFLGVLVGFGLWEAQQRVAKVRAGKWLQAALALLLALIVVDLLIFSLPRLNSFKDEQDTARKLDHGFTMTNDSWSSLARHSYPLKGKGTLACYNPHALPAAPGLRAGLPSQVYAAPGTKGRAYLSAWSPNGMEFEANLEAPGIIVVNQNHHRGWQADRGEVIRYVPPAYARRNPKNGLLAVELEAGKHTVALSYVAPGFKVGVALTALGLVLSLGWLLWFTEERWTRLKRRVLPGGKRARESA